MHYRSAGILTGFIVSALCLCGASLAWGAEDSLPPRSEWRATASSPSAPSMAPAMAIDGDAGTRWDGNFAPGNAGVPFVGDIAFPVLALILLIIVQRSESAPRIS